MTDTPAQQRLNNYLAAEARILTAGFSIRLDLRQRQEAELAEIRKGIRECQMQVAAEQGRHSNRSSLRSTTMVPR